MSSFLPTHRLFGLVLVSMAVSGAAWGAFGHLDIVVTATGKLVPTNYVQVSQPVESGVVKEVLVKDGSVVSAGQVLVRLDPLYTAKDVESAYAERIQLGLRLVRINAELSGSPFMPADISAFVGADSQSSIVLLSSFETLKAASAAEYSSRRQAFLASKHDAQFTEARAEADLSSAEARLEKLSKTSPLAAEQAEMWARLHKEGFVSRAATADKLLAQFDLDGELSMQRRIVESARLARSQASLSSQRVDTEYVKMLSQEKSEVEAALAKVKAELEKREHRAAQTVLRAPVAGMVSGLALKTAGQVVQGGGALLSLVPLNEPLMFEGWLKNEDAGYVTPGMPLNVKLATYPFQKYGWLEGEVVWVGADAETPETMRNASGEPLFYRLRGKLKAQAINRDNKTFPAKAGMQAVTDIQIGERSPLEYLTSPLKKVLLESAREK
jgi:hemolysin D